MKIFYPFITLILFSLLSYSQEKTKITEDSDNSLVRTFWKANRETSYLSAAPYVSSIGKRRIPTIQGEGTSDVQLLEAFLNLSFPLFYGKPTNKRLIALEYTGNFRMTLDDSKPLTPGSHHIGVSMHHILKKYYNVDDISKKRLKFITSRIQVKHYSNGQSPGFFYEDPNNPSNKRNNYLNGDFSTNYVSLMITKGHLNRELGSLHQFSLGYRHDLGTETSVFAFSEGQEQSYGRNRFSFIYDFRTERSFAKNFEHHMRFSTEYIVGNLDNFRANLNSNKKYRANFKFLYELAPENHYSVGYFLSAYYGRDYLNIRYDDIIFSIQLGVTLSLDKFFMNQKT